MTTHIVTHLMPCRSQLQTTSHPTITRVEILRFSAPGPASDTGGQPGLKRTDCLQDICLQVLLNIMKDMGNEILPVLALIGHQEDTIMPQCPPPLIQPRAHPGDCI